MRELLFTGRAQIIGAAIIIAPAAVQDLRKKCVSFRYLLVACLGAVVYAGSAVLLGERSAADILLCLVPASGMAVMSFIGKQSVGTADAVMLLITGLLIGARENCLLLMISLFLSAAAGILLLIFKKARLRTKIPFLPFMAAGLVCLLTLL